jgi:hypothetical protein
MLPNNFDHAVGCGAGRKEADVLSVRVDQVYERRVIDDVIGAAGRIFRVVDLVGIGHTTDLLGTAG